MSLVPFGSPLGLPLRLCGLVSALWRGRSLWPGFPPFARVVVWFPPFPRRLCVVRFSAPLACALWAIIAPLGRFALRVPSAARFLRLRPSELG